MPKQIHWFPGHMKKALIDVSERAKLVDIIVELVDARAPISSRNKYLKDIAANKERLIVLTKKDLADDKSTEEWIAFLQNEMTHVISANLNDKNDIKSIINKINEAGKPRQEKQIAKGMKPQPVRAMIIGIPNVGKSSLINKVANRKAASVQNKPGHTKSQQWIKVSSNFELLDTPGILPMNFEDELASVNLALVGSIKETVLPIEELANKLLDFLKAYNFTCLSRYNVFDKNLDNYSIFENIAKSRGFFKRDQFDIDKAEIVLLNEFKNGILGKFTLENPFDARV